MARISRIPVFFLFCVAIPYRHLGIIISYNNNNLLNGIEEILSKGMRRKSMKTVETENTLSLGAKKLYGSA